VVSGVMRVRVNLAGLALLLTLICDVSRKGVTFLMCGPRDRLCRHVPMVISKAIR